MSSESRSPHDPSLNFTNKTLESNCCDDISQLFFESTIQSTRFEAVLYTVLTSFRNSARPKQSHGAVATLHKFLKHLANWLAA